MENLDKDLCEFFFRLTKENLTDVTHPERLKLVKKVLPEIRRKLKADRPKKDIHFRSLQLLRNVGVSSHLEDAAQSYEYATCLASSTAATFSEVMSGQTEFFDVKVRRKGICICCIAGGMGLELVALVEALCRGASAGSMHEFLPIQLSIIDCSDGKWDSVTKSVLGRLGEVAMAQYQVKLTSVFVRWKNRGDVLDVLRSSDVLVATKFSQLLSDMRIKLFRLLLDETLQHMKPDSLLFVLDTSAATIIQYVEQDISRFGRFETVYKKACGKHLLSLDSARQHLKRYKEYFGVDMSRSYCFFTARAWLKLEKRRDSFKERLQACPKANRDETIA